ncbi:hypothetical protein EXIGLDRAFT_331330 [Exidia glandulosa HHB12029]|uniref:Uncharacterized protein n=1 Tax=Exidia glandulosa HHB12029 TaxID=1314781 RepID=A0A165CQX6_EXIGL|nr:hypothetical protein EXIGLDRAFT_331330 [Exidia glandulosa HHB12029]
MERRALKRVWVPPSRVAAEPRIHTSPSLPLRELLRVGRPLFECASCGFSHDRGLPICLWCLWSDVESARAWAASAPRARTLSAPSTVYRQIITSTPKSGTTIPHRNNVIATQTTHMPHSTSTMQHSTPAYSRPNSYHIHEHRSSTSRPSSPHIASPSRPSTPDSALATGQPKFAAYVARKTAQRHVRQTSPSHSVDSSRL